MTNIFTSYLELLGVKYTHLYSDKYFEQHPHKYNLFGLSKMLAEYDIESKGIRIDNKEAIIHKLNTPFIAHLGTEFVAVKAINSQKVDYIWNGDRITVDKNTFLEKWSGNCLLAETNEHSKEPDYKKNQRDEIISHSLKIILIMAVVLFFFISFLTNKIYEHTGNLLLLTVNILGIYISYLLVQKQMNKSSKYADKICSLFKQNDCNDILDTSVAKLGGIIGWSEIGLGYFISNILIITLFPSLTTYLALVNICALPYTVWSIWYQKFKAKQWCTLCVIVQLLLWAIFSINLVFSYIQLPSSFVISDILSTGIIYAVPALLINLFLPVYTRSKRINHISHEINNLKMSDEVFLSSLKQQQQIEAKDSDSRILFGDPNARLKITVLTNPHCNPCSIMHKRLIKLLKDTNNKICVQYVFSSFHESLDDSCLFLISTYLNNEKETVHKIYHEWYSGGNQEKESFFKKYNFTEDKEARLEFNKHTQWKEINKLTATPTVIINGYNFPENYKIEDMKYFTELDIDIN